MREKITLQFEDELIEKLVPVVRHSITSVRTLIRRLLSELAGSDSASSETQVPDRRDPRQKY
jgi:hypothetical protein